MIQKQLKKIVVIGASSVAGKVDVEGGGFVGRLSKWMESQYPYNAVFNLGISGNTSDQILARILAESIPRKPDLIILQCGINDLMREGSINAPNQISINQIEVNIRDLIQKAQSIADLLIVSVFPIDESKTTPFAGKNWYYTLADAKAHSLLTRKLTTELGIAYIDIFTEFEKLDYKGQLIYSDGLHTNAQGHELIFQKIKSYIESNYVTQRDN